MKFDFKKIYVQRAIYDDFLWRQNAENIISRFPNAELVEVESHWKIPELYEADTLVYDYAMRRRELAAFEERLVKALPYCPVRYSF